MITSPASINPTVKPSLRSSNDSIPSILKSISPAFRSANLISVDSSVVCSAENLFNNFTYYKQNTGKKKIYEKKSKENLINGFTYAIMLKINQLESLR